MLEILVVETSMEFSFCQYAIAISAVSPEPDLPSSQQTIDSLSASLNAYLSYQKDSSKLVVSMEGVSEVSSDAAQQLLSAIAEVSACTKIVNCNPSVFLEMKIEAIVTGRYTWLQPEGASVPSLFFGELAIEDRKVLSRLDRFTSQKPIEIAEKTGMSLEYVNNILAKYLRLHVICLRTSDSGKVHHILPFGGSVAAHE